MHQLMTLVTASLEIAGKLLFDNGLASRMRPRKYYTVSKASLETSLDDIEQLVNFFVIEGQRVLFAENVYSTIAVSHPYCHVNSHTPDIIRSSLRPLSPTFSSRLFPSGAWL